VNYFVCCVKIYACGDIVVVLNGSRNITIKHRESYMLSDRADVNQPNGSNANVGAAMLLTSHQPRAGGN
jgi:hypothetical protein